MSGYEYYEFRATDRPLDRTTMDDLRNLSSRAELSPIRLAITHNYGSFRGDPADLMDRHFDAFLHISNWGRRDLSFRLPSGALDREAAGAYETERGLVIREAKSHVVVDFQWWGEGCGGHEIEGDRLMPELLPVRDLLLRGDLRAFYIAWLSSLTCGDDEDRKPIENVVEPPVPPGLKDLPPELQAMSDFLQVDPLLLQAAAQASEGEAPSAPSRAQVARWIRKLPADERSVYLVRLVADGEGEALRTEILTRIRHERPPTATRAETGPRRTIAELSAARDALLREQRKAAARARTAHLDTLKRRGEAVWDEIAEAIQKRNAEGYDEAVDRLVDLRDLAVHSGDVKAFQERLAALRRIHRGKPAFLDRLERKMGA